MHSARLCVTGQQEDSREEKHCRAVPKDLKKGMFFFLPFQVRWRPQKKYRSRVHGDIRCASFGEHFKNATEITSEDRRNCLTPSDPPTGVPTSQFSPLPRRAIIRGAAAMVAEIAANSGS